MFAEMEIDRIRRVFETNVFGAMLCVREAVRMDGNQRRRRRWCRISKGAIDTLTIGLAKEETG